MCSYSSKVRHKASVVSAQSQKAAYFMKILGWRQSFTVRILSASIDIKSAVTRYHKYFTSYWNNALFITFNFSPAVVIRCRTSPRFLICSSEVLPITIASTNYTRQVFQRRPLSTCSISHSNVAGALQSPNGIT